MDIVNNLLFWLHLVALALGGVAAFGIPVVGSRMASVDVVSRPLLFSIVEGLSTVGRVGFGILIVTGPLLIWLKYGGMAGFTIWFTLKMVFVIILLVSVIASGVLGKRAQHGDMSVLPWLPRLGILNVVALLAIVLCAVFAFN